MLRQAFAAIALAALAGVASAQEAGAWRNESFRVEYGAAGWRTLSDPTQNAAFAVAPTDADDVRCALFAHPEVTLPGGPFASQTAINHAVAVITSGREGYSVVQTEAGFNFAETLIRERQRTYRSYMFGVYEAGRAAIYDLQCGAQTEAALATTRLRPLVNAIRLN